MGKCKFAKDGVTKWKIDPHFVGHSKIKGTNTNIHESMLKKVEYAGMFQLVQKEEKDCNGNKCKKIVTNFVTPLSINGGDGMFCHIDQDDGQIHIVSSQFGNYRISTNGGASFSGGVFVNGSFVNISDYDNDANILCQQMR